MGDFQVHTIKELPHFDTATVALRCRNVMTLTNLRQDKNHFLTSGTAGFYLGMNLIQL